MVTTHLLFGGGHGYGAERGAAVVNLVRGPRHLALFAGEQMTLRREMDLYEGHTPQRCLVLGRACICEALGLVAEIGGNAWNGVMAREADAVGDVGPLVLVRVVGVLEQRQLEV